MPPKRRRTIDEAPNRRQRQCIALFQLHHLKQPIKLGNTYFLQNSQRSLSYLTKAICTQALSRRNTNIIAEYSKETSQTTQQHNEQSIRKKKGTRPTTTITQRGIPRSWRPNGFNGCQNSTIRQGTQSIS